MSCHDTDVEGLSPRMLIRINSLIELKYFLMALTYYHKKQNTGPANGQ